MPPCDQEQPPTTTDTRPGDVVTADGDLRRRLRPPKDPDEQA